MDVFLRSNDSLLIPMYYHKRNKKLNKKIKWNTSILLFTDWKVLLLFICYLLLLLFSDYSLPLSRLIIPNPYGKFKLEKRNIIFEGHDLNSRSLMLKKGIWDGILEVFVLSYYLCLQNPYGATNVELFHCYWSNC
jgi:hypothetical protein